MSEDFFEICGEVSWVFGCNDIQRKEMGMVIHDFETGGCSLQGQSQTLSSKTEQTSSWSRGTSTEIVATLGEKMVTVKPDSSVTTIDRLPNSLTVDSSNY